MLFDFKKFETILSFERFIHLNFVDDLFYKNKKDHGELKNFF